MEIPVIWRSKSKLLGFKRKEIYCSVIFLFDGSKPTHRVIRVGHLWLPTQCRSNDWLCYFTHLPVSYSARMTPTAILHGAVIHNLSSLNPSTPCKFDGTLNQGHVAVVHGTDSAENWKGLTAMDASQVDQEVGISLNKRISPRQASVISAHVVGAKIQEDGIRAKVRVLKQASRLARDCILEKLCHSYVVIAAILVDALAGNRQGCAVRWKCSQSCAA